MKNSLEVSYSAVRPVVAVIALGIFAGVKAQGAENHLEGIIISGSRTASAWVDTGSTVSVINGSELEQRQIRFVSEALRSIPGIAVSRQGPAGTVTQVRVRGAEANHTVVLIDGVKINDPFTSEVDFAHLLTAQIERIEVLRGPQSVIYGSEAIGGVISIFTKRATRGIELEASAEAGSFSTISGAFAARGAAESFDYAVSVNAFNTDGTNVSRFGSEDDGYRNQTFYARAGWTPSTSFALEASLRYRETRSRFDPQDFGFPPTPTFGLVVDGDRRSTGDQLDAGVRGRLITGAVEHQVAFSRVRSNEDTFADGDFAGGFAGQRTRFDYQGSWRFGAPTVPQTLTVAAEHERQRFESTGTSALSDQNQVRENDKTGIAAEYRVRLPTQTAVTLSGRSDHHQLFDDATTYRVTVAQPVGQLLKLRASYGSAIANPTFFELFGFIPGSFTPNPALKPETSRGFDVGADFAIARAGRLSLTYFDADLRDEIATTFDTATFRSSVANLSGSSKRRGAEVEAQYAASDQLTVGVAYTYLHSKQSDEQVEVRRPRHAASVALTYELATTPAALTLAVDHNGRQQDLQFTTFGAARVTLRDYTLVRLAGRYALTRNFSITARVENLLDQSYEEIFSYRPSGRAYYAGLQASF